MDTDQLSDAVAAPAATVSSAGDEQKVVAATLREIVLYALYLTVENPSRTHVPWTLR